MAARRGVYTLIMRSVMIILTVWLGACHPHQASHQTDQAAVDGAARLEEARGAASEGRLDEAFDLVSAAIVAGAERPSRIAASGHFDDLLDDPALRPRMFELLRTHAHEHDVSIRSTHEGAEPMVVTIRVVAGESEPPRPRLPVAPAVHARVGIVHTDPSGYYQPYAANQDWNPRHFAFGVTDESGVLVVRTVRPGYYAPEYEAPDEPRHMHYTIDVGGVLLRASEFYFNDDPRLHGEVRRHAEEGWNPIAEVTRDADGVWRADVVIPVRGLPQPRPSRPPHSMAGSCSGDAPDWRTPENGDAGRRRPGRGSRCAPGPQGSPRRSGLSYADTEAAYGRASEDAARGSASAAPSSSSRPSGNNGPGNGSRRSSQRAGPFQTGSWIGIVSRS